MTETINQLLQLVIHFLSIIGLIVAALFIYLFNLYLHR